MNTYLWGGEGSYTRTGGQRPSMVNAPAPIYAYPLCSSNELWCDTSHDCLDAPDHIARGGVIAYEFGTDTVMFASEPRP